MFAGAISKTFYDTRHVLVFFGYSRPPPNSESAPPDLSAQFYGFTLGVRLHWKYSSQNMLWQCYD
jgi:hypothetical protein